MSVSFAEALAAWNAFYALAGGAAATLLGLLFVAVSFRLDIFRREDVADVRDFATFTVATFLVAIIIAGLALAPHDKQSPMAGVLFAIGLGGLLGTAYVAREWVRLNLPKLKDRPGYTPFQWQGWAYMIGMAGAYVAILVAALLLWLGHVHMLGWLAVAETWQLAMGTIAAWVMLSHAGASGGDGGS